jgi:hypothetical protein
MNAESQFADKLCGSGVTQVIYYSHDKIQKPVMPAKKYIHNFDWEVSWNMTT